MGQVSAKTRNRTIKEFQLRDNRGSTDLRSLNMKYHYVTGKLLSLVEPYIITARLENLPLYASFHVIGLVSTFHFV